MVCGFTLDFRLYILILASMANSTLLIGMALGDAHGLLMENMPPHRIGKLYPNGLPPFGILGGRGLVSDDTEHAALTAHAFAVSAGDLDRFERVLADNLKRWLWAVPPASGLATGRALIKLSVGFPPNKSGVRSAGNGPCMRAPILGALAKDDNQLWGLTWRSSRMTHTDPMAIEGAYLVGRWSYLATRLARKPSWEEFLDECEEDRVPRASPVRAILQKVRQSVSHGETAQAFCAKQGWKKGPTGFVVHTVAAAMHVSYCASSWEQGVRSAVLLGGDTDSVAALVGGMLATVPGFDLPTLWISHLRDRPYTHDYLSAIEHSAREAALTGKSVEASRPAYLATLVRNLGFLVIVLYYGVRRLLP